MSQWESVRHQVAIAGRVTDTQSGKPVGGVRVEITAPPPSFSSRLQLFALAYGDGWELLARRPDRTETGPDGTYHFLDLPDGQYTLGTSLPGSGTRYGGSQSGATVSRDAQGRVLRAVTDLSVRPTTLKGVITGADSAPVPMAEVRLRGSTARAYTDKVGRYQLSGLEAGQHTIQVLAQGYQEVSRTVTLAQGSEHTLDVALAAATP